MIMEVKDLSFSYPNGRRIFSGVNISLEAGEILTILGPNGAGKSTLLNCLANLLKPSGGEIRMDGKNIHAIGLREAAKILGYVHQTHPRLRLQRAGFRGDGPGALSGHVSETVRRGLCPRG